MLLVGGQVPEQSALRLVVLVRDHEGVVARACELIDAFNECVMVTR